ncbi:sugar O-acetyltransferase [Jeotgalibaca sp. A127]|uniref:sugar O-acetyltransferase n=1 Tax=Jeotgalibaca sp. A127 TaxID=3457324 RepID=UPI003FD126EB
MDFKKVMFSGEIYNPDNGDILEEQRAYNELLFDLNQLRPTQIKQQEEKLKQLLGHYGKGSYIQLPLYANWGCHTHFGKNCYANFNLTLVDDAPIYIGDDVMFGPNVTLSAGTHPIDPEARKKHLQYNQSITIADNVWIGANVVVMPGVTIGENSVIGAGSVVTRDIPANVVAVGSPCRVLRDITEADKIVKQDL